MICGKLWYAGKGCDSVLITRTSRKTAKLDLRSNNSPHTTTSGHMDITIIYPPTVDWNMLYQRPQQLMSAFSQIPGVRAIYLNNDAYKPMSEAICQVNPNLFVVKPGVEYRHLIKGKKILWFNYPPHYQLTEQENYDLVVFDAIDNPVEEMEFWAVDLDKAVNCAGLISCTARILYEQHQSSGKPLFMCPNGADYQHFSQASRKSLRPRELATIPSNVPIIGFYGAMASWVDYELVIKIAERYQVVLIGKNQYYNLGANHDNILNIDHVDYEELPHYLACFDVAIIPFKLTELIKGCDPIKFYEYLSAGKPIVATQIEELKRRFRGVTYFMTAENCHTVIAKALAEDNPVIQSRRMSVARQNTWMKRAQIAINSIRLHLGRNLTLRVSRSQQEGI